MSSSPPDAGSAAPSKPTPTAAPTTPGPGTSSTAGPSSCPALMQTLKSDPVPRTTSPRQTQSTPQQMAATPTSLSEWQLLAVLHRANLVQYYEVFISQGGDDINQIMQCDEHEFLEIMSLVGMLSKPLHVRRLQRALNEFSKDQASFNITALQQIGPPPVSPYSLNGADPMTLLLPGSLLNSLAASSDGVRSNSASPSHLPTASTSSATGAPGGSTSHGANNSVALAVELAPAVLELPLAADRRVSSGGGGDDVVVKPRSGLVVAGSSSRCGDVPASAAVFGQQHHQHHHQQQQQQQLPQPQQQQQHLPRATANVVSGHHLGYHFGPAAPVVAAPAQQQQQPTDVQHGRGRGSTAGQEKEGSTSPFLAIQPTNDFVSLGDFDPNNPTTENPVLSAAQIARLAECALASSRNLPHLPPRYVQNKKRISKEVLDLLSPQASTASTSAAQQHRVQQFRKFSAIYGRFDTKRKPHKVLSLHETAVNEGAAQLCLLVPALLTRRDELFPLARQIVKDAGYQYAKSRKRPCDPADLHSPMSSPSSSPPPTSGLADADFDVSPSARSSTPSSTTTTTPTDTQPLTQLHNPSSDDVPGPSRR